MTHVQHAERYARLVDYCTGLGGKYNPGRQTLQLSALQAQVNQAKQALTQVIVAKAHFDKAVNQRRLAFAVLNRLSASVMRTLEASGASAGVLADARAFVQQIQGRSRKLMLLSPAEHAEAPVRKYTRMQQSFVSRADFFAKLLQVLATEPLYQSNEAHLALPALQQTLLALHQHNEAVSQARVAWNNAIIQRNYVLYDHAQSLLHIARAVRKYVRAIFGLNSQEFAPIASLYFTKPKN